MKELAIGEVGVVAGETVRCVEKEVCGKCFFWPRSVAVCESIKCTRFERQDGQSVMYILPDTNTNANSCTWTEDPDGIWYTSCEHAHEFTSGTPEENDHRYCPYCGKVLEAKEHDGEN